MTLLFLLNFSNIAILAGTAIASLALGLLYKSALVAKQKKRILHLEDEMLSNHSTILALEKKISDFQKGVTSDYNLTKGKLPDQGLKAS
jgi:hypothetical protein